MASPCAARHAGYNGNRLRLREQGQQSHRATTNNVRANLNTGTISAFVASLLLQVGFPLAVTLIYRRRTAARWLLFAYGAIVFAVFQLFTWLPLSAYLDAVIGSRLDSELGAFVWLLTLALATSLVEESGRWLGYRHLFPRGGFRLTWRNGVMYGLGHASLETMLLIAGLTFINLVAYLVFSRLDVHSLIEPTGANATAAVSGALQSLADTSWDQPLVVALERMLALPHQVAWGLLVMQSQLSRQKRWFGFAVLYHSSVAVIVPGLARLFGFLVAEGANVILVSLSLGIILRLRAVSVATPYVEMGPRPRRMLG